MSSGYGKIISTILRRLALELGFGPSAPDPSYLFKFPPSLLCQVGHLKLLTEKRRTKQNSQEKTLGTSEQLGNK